MPGADGQFYADIRRRARLSSDDEARQVACAVLRSLGKVLGGRTSARLRVHVPGELAASLPGAFAEPDETVDGQLFVGPLVNTMDVQYGYDATLGGMDLVAAYADDDAAVRATAVFWVLKARLDGSLRREVAAALPPPMGDWWRRA